MPVLSHEARHHRARVAALSRDRGSDDPELTQAQDDLRNAMLRERAKKIVDDWAPLTDQQRQDIAAILLTGSSRGSGDAA
ncbi:hypothetical protein [Mycolicibacterium psychrotolerans]|uniref:PhiRv1 phage protein n=1 Tax=Mycolicibacterium psychrotolerans TaxID=216929 RepID=A0A7I7MD50_9MYCO|nr:hypothetical protein [Mycolicibacterium psychrotolerans]BBX69707.1 hypothetical protein MPSYJ_31680 [Mycolicibacterium psychrotolerans]